MRSIFCIKCSIICFITSHNDKIKVEIFFAFFAIKKQQNSRHFLFFFAFLLLNQGGKKPVCPTFFVLLLVIFFSSDILWMDNTGLWQQPVLSQVKKNTGRLSTDLAAGFGTNTMQIRWLFRRCLGEFMTKVTVLLLLFLHRSCFRFLVSQAFSCRQRRPSRRKARQFQGETAVPHIVLVYSLFISSSLVFFRS